MNMRPLPPQRHGATCYNLAYSVKTLLVPRVSGIGHTGAFSYFVMLYYLLLPALHYRLHYFLKVVGPGVALPMLLFEPWEKVFRS